MKKKKVLFVDRDGTLILETDDFKIEKFEKLVFYPNVFHYFGKIARELGYELALVSNQDGLGTADYPEDEFWQVQDFIMRTFKNEEIHFSGVFIDKSFPEDNLPTRKPGTGMLTQYFSDGYDLANSFVIGDRITDIKLAKNLGCKGIWLNDGQNLGATEINDSAKELKEYIALETRDWKKVYEYLKGISAKTDGQ